MKSLTTVLFLLLQQVAKKTLATPIDTDLYHHILDENGHSGPCRGTTASDKVDSRSKGSMTQIECESECTSNGENCVAYSYSESSEDGLCIIYGPGQDGTCSSHPMKEIRDQCGECSFTNKHDKGTCGSCEIPEGTPIYAGASSYADNEGLCDLQGGVWTEGTWTPGVWDEPEDGWEGSSHFTTHVHYVTAVNGFDCYDKDQSDHLPKCSGTTDDGSMTCQERFEAETEGMELFELTEADCIAGGSGCVFTPAPIPPARIFFVHSPISTTPGWNPHNVPFGDALNPDIPIALGACRAEGTQIAPPTQKDCRWDLCTSSQGESVNTQAGCRQACLDDPSGTCVAYSHADNGYCVLHGPLVHQHPEHIHSLDGKDWVDTWDTRERELKFCLGNIPNNPPGCKDANTAKPNPRYMCQTLKTTPERWQAYGPEGVPKQINLSVQLSDVVASELENEETTLRMRQKVADMIFWHVDKTILTNIEDLQLGADSTASEVQFDIVILTDSTAAPHQLLLIFRQIEWASTDPEYFGLIFADAFPVGVTPLFGDASITDVQKIEEEVVKDEDVVKEEKGKEDHSGHDHSTHDHGTHDHSTDKGEEMMDSEKTKEEESSAPNKKFLVAFVATLFHSLVFAF